jgi:hypothetical protein
MGVAVVVLAVGNPAAAIEQVVVPEGGVQSLDPGAYKLTSLEIRKGGTLKVLGPTSIMTAKLVAQDGAKILYESTKRIDDGQMTITVTQDASELDELEIVVNGKAGTPTFGPGDRAGGGGAGRNASKPRPHKFDDGRPGSAGGPGGAGKGGGDGENAFDVSVYLVNARAGSHLRVSAVGGDGGSGQAGGPGGRGGNGVINHDCRGGGKGGSGGNGGRGGDAGKVNVFLVVQDTKSGEARRLKSGFKLEANAARGEAGRSGAGGPGGPRGDRGGNPSQCPAQNGAPGAPGTPGPEGEGPRPQGTGPRNTWVKTTAVQDSQAPACPGVI